MRLLWWAILLPSFNPAGPSRPRPVTGDGLVLRVDPIIFPHPLRIGGWFREGHVIQGERIGILPSPTRKVLNSLVMRQYGWKCGVFKHHACRLTETTGRKKRAEGEKEI